MSRKVPPREWMLSTTNSKDEEDSLFSRSSSWEGYGDEEEEDAAEERQNINNADDQRTDNQQQLSLLPHHQHNTANNDIGFPRWAWEGGTATAASAHEALLTAAAAHSDPRALTTTTTTTTATPAASSSSSTTNTTTALSTTNDRERQLLLLMLLAQVCALHDPTPRFFIVHVLALFERGILDRQSIVFLFELGLVPSLHPHTESTTSSPTVSPPPSPPHATTHATTTTAAASSTTTSTKTSPSSTASLLAHQQQQQQRVLEARAIRLSLEQQERQQHEKQQQRSSGTAQQPQHKPDSPATSPGNTNNPSFSWSAEHYPLSLSRYQRDFFSLSLLSSGSFGHVYHVQSKWDGRPYALKRVAFAAHGTFSNTKLPLVLREVQCLAACHHPHVVRYYTSWLEPSWMTGGGNNSNQHTPALTMGDSLVEEEEEDESSYDNGNSSYRTQSSSLWRKKSSSRRNKQTAAWDGIIHPQLMHDLNQVVLMGDSTRRKSKGGSPSSRRRRRRYSFDNASSHDRWGDVATSSSSESGSNTSSSGTSDDEDTTGWWKKQQKSARPSSSASWKWFDNFSGGSKDDFFADHAYRYRSSSNRKNNKRHPSSKQQRHSQGLSTNQPKRQQQLSTQTAYQYQICLYIQMQLCQSSTLADWIRLRNAQESTNTDATTSTTLASRRLPAIQRIWQQLIQGLDHVHERNIVHRDLKPANIFAARVEDSHTSTATDDISLLHFQIGDFGLSQLLRGNGERPSQSQHQQHPTPIATPAVVTAPSSSPSWQDPLTAGVGTASYAAPEQVSSRHYGTAADIFSLGLILLEMMSCFQTEHERLQTFWDCRHRQQLPSEIPPRVARWILACTNPAESERPTARTLLEEAMVLLIEEEGSKEAVDFCDTNVEASPAKGGTTNVEVGKQEDSQTEGQPNHETENPAKTVRETSATSLSSEATAAAADEIKRLRQQLAARDKEILHLQQLVRHQEERLKVFEQQQQQQQQQQSVSAGIYTYPKPSVTPTMGQVTVAHGSNNSNGGTCHARVDVDAVSVQSSSSSEDGI